MGKKSDASDRTMLNILLVLVSNGESGLTNGQIARKGGISKGWCHKLLDRLIETGEVYRCELPHGTHGMYTKTLYFTETKMEKMLGKKPEKGRVYQLAQTITTKVVEN